MSNAFTIVYEDNHLLVVNKSAGILVQGDETGDVPLSELCKQYVKEKYNKPGAVFMGVVHRLDRPVSGIVVLAKTSKALERMNALFREKETTKTYWAIVESRPKASSATLVNWLKKDERKNKTTAFSKETPGTLRSELSYQVVGSSHDKFLLEVKPITGRPHQIRVQLAGMGCPIVGDVKYGASHALEDASICLHAFSLEFVHPVKKERVKFEVAPPQNEFWKLFI